MLVVGGPVPIGWVNSASASPLSVRSSSPPPRTVREVSVTSAVKLFVITRLNSTCSRPSVPWTRCGAPVVVTCNAVTCDAADASVRAAEAGTASRAIAETRASAKVIRRRDDAGLVLTVLQSAGQDELVSAKALPGETATR